MQTSRGDVTGLLLRWSGGDAQALEQLIPIVYDELRRLTRYHLRGKGDACTVPGTALVHEVYLRLCQVDRLQLENRAHFFAVASQMMRRILVDQARRRRAQKRGGPKVPLEEAFALAAQDGEDLVTLNESLDELAAVDPRKARVVEMRFFGGLSAKEIAAVLSTTEATVRRDWTIARAWLYRRMEAAGAE
jgi:RNA polymerase sigma factor (TIGR02999 family)